MKDEYGYKDRILEECIASARIEGSTMTVDKYNEIKRTKRREINGQDIKKDHKAIYDSLNRLEQKRNELAKVREKGLTRQKNAYNTHIKDQFHKTKIDLGEVIIVDGKLTHKKRES